jgi:hypothetical protein
VLIVAAQHGVHWRINLPEGVGLPSTTTVSYGDLKTSSNIRLVDWREWNRMRSSFTGTIGAPPLLIIDADSPEEHSLEATTHYLIPESIPEESEDNHTIESTSSSTSTTTTTTTPLPETTTSNSTEDPSETTTLKTNPDVTLELRNLPDILALLKHLAVIPAVVRSFSNAAMAPSSSSSTDPNPIGAFLAASAQQPIRNVDDLRSRALSANSGYSARSPQFVTAPPAEAEMPQVRQESD